MRVLNFCMAAVLLSLAIGPTSPVNILKYSPPSSYLLDSSGLVNIWRMRVLNFCIAAVLLSLAIGPTSPVDMLKFCPSTRHSTANNYSFKCLMTTKYTQK
jgi:hypothetical protein